MIPAPAGGTACALCISTFLRRHEAGNPVGNSYLLSCLKAGGQRSHEFIPEIGITVRKAELNIICTDKSIVGQGKFTIEHITRIHPGKRYRGRLSNNYCCRDISFIGCLQGYGVMILNIRGDNAPLHSNQFIGKKDILRCGYAWLNPASSCLLLMILSADAVPVPACGNILEHHLTQFISGRVENLIRQQFIYQAYSGIFYTLYNLIPVINSACIDIRDLENGAALTGLAHCYKQGDMNIRMIKRTYKQICKVVSFLNST